MTTPRGLTDAGISLVELLIYMMLSLLVLSIVGGIWLNGLSSERVVRQVTEAANVGQLAAESIEHGVRNSSGFDVSTPTGQDQLLRVRTAGGDDVISWSCAAWYYSDANHSIRYRTSETAIEAPNSTELESWTLLADGVGPGNSDRVFSSFSTRLEINFQVAAGDHEPVIIQSSALSRTEVMETAPCV